MKNSADQLRWITPSEICQILHILRKPNSKFWFIQNNSKLKNKLKHAYLGRCKVHIDSASLWGSLGDEALFRSANIRQIADHRIKMFSNISSLILFHITAPSVPGLCTWPHFESEGFGPKLSLSKWGQVYNLSCENEFDLQWKVISISKAEHLTSFWYRGLGELGSGLMFSHLFWREQTGILFFGGKFDSSLFLSPL